MKSKLILAISALLAFSAQADIEIQEEITLYAGDIAMIGNSVEGMLAHRIYKECGSLKNFKVSEVEIVIRSTRFPGPGEQNTVTSKDPTTQFSEARVFFSWYPTAEVKAQLQCL